MAESEQLTSNSNIPSPSTLSSTANAHTRTPASSQPLPKQAAQNQHGDQNARVEVSIVSNSRLLREGLVTLLAAHIDLCIVGSYTGEIPTNALLPNPPGHVILLDGGVGLEAAIRWARYWRCLEAPAYVVALELANDVESILRCIEAGVGGYTCNGASAAEVAEAIRSVRRGIAVCAPEVTARVFARLEALGSVSTQPLAFKVPLTPRELEILGYIAEDYSNQAIASILVIEVCTVKHHVHNILEKLQLRHRHDAVHYAWDRGWLSGSRQRRTPASSADLESRRSFSD